MWVFLSICVLCATGLLAVHMSLRHDWRSRKMVEDARIQRTMIETTAKEIEGWNHPRGLDS